jgi:aspartyl aminopeptidase
LFDHEEVGSQSAPGAGSSWLPRLLERLSLASGHSLDEHARALSRSRCVSADMAHAVHPNYAHRHEPHHRARLNGGPVIKYNVQQRYATSARTAAEFAALCTALDIPTQRYAHRSDMPCGSTIGPIAATVLGIETVDVGNPMLSMHSAREMAGSRDPELMVRALSHFLASG